MLITENASYIRKESPKYVPQILVLGLRWNDWEPQKNIDRIVQQHFPVERLEAMIDRAAFHATLRARFSFEEISLAKEGREGSEKNSRVCAARPGVAGPAFRRITMF
jgi:hypothetical protein